ncbi:MAG: lysophospholipid acyltransferase family protein [Cyclobacteriaceae bacterium]
MLVLAKIFGIIPFWILYPLGDILSYPVSWIYRREVVFNNLKTAFPEKSDQELRIIRRQFYKNFLNIIIEVIKIPSMSAEHLNRRIKLTNPELIEREFKANRSVVIFASHFCNWEWTALAVNSQTSFRLDPVYKIQANKMLDDFIYYLRSKFGGEPIPKENAVRNMLKNKDTVRAIGFVADQRPFKKGTRIWLDFLGKETAFFPGTVAIPYITQFPIYYMRINRLKRGYYEGELTLLGEPPHQKNDPAVLRRYVTEIENQIRQSPSDWLWSHKRWKYNRSSEEELLS